MGTPYRLRFPYKNYRELIPIEGKSINLLSDRFELLELEEMI